MKRWSGKSDMFDNSFLGITLQRINIFIAAARFENFRETADKLNMTQASVSRNISLLEEETGLILFIRFKQRVKLTRAGRQFAADMEKMLSAFNKASKNALDIQKCDYNKITIGDYNTTSSDDYLFPIVRAFEEKNPQTEVSIVRRHPQDIIEGMNEQRFDLIFALAVSPDMFTFPNVQVETIRPAVPKIIISKNHSLYEKEDLTFKDLLSCPPILLKAPFYSFYNENALRIMRQYGFSESRIYYADDPYDISLELKRGDRVAFLDQMYAPDGKHNFRYIDLPECSVKFGIQIVYSADNENPFLMKFIRESKTQEDTGGRFFRVQ